MTFMEQFEARMYKLKLDRALRDKITTPAIKPEELDEETQAREDAVAVRDDMRYQVWCELVLCLDRRSISFVRSHKPNSDASWKALLQQYRSSERPRIQNTMTRLMDVKMESDEAVTDYLIRAEEMQMDLHEVGEHMSDAMFKAIVLKGLPREYENIVTLFNQGEEK